MAPFNIHNAERLEFSPFISVHFILHLSLFPFFYLVFLLIFLPNSLLPFSLLFFSLRHFLISSSIFLLPHLLLLSHSLPLTLSYLFLLYKELRGL
jgi:hypothetical protein